MTTTDIPAFPFARSNPFDPPPRLVDALVDGAPIAVRTPPGSVAWLVTRYTDVRALLRDQRISAETHHPGFPLQSPGARRSPSFLAMDDPAHAVLRRMLTPEFLVKRMDAMRPRIQQIVDELIDDLLAQGPPADLVSGFAIQMPSLVICELLGVPAGDRERFQSASNVAIATGSTAAQVQEAVGQLAGFLGGLLTRKEAQPSDDVLGRLVVDQIRPGHLTVDEAVEMAIMLLVAGHETTANMISLGILAMLQHPETLAEVRATDDPAVIAGAVEELLRYLSILHLGRSRVALTDMEVGGQLIKAGDGIIVMLNAANRDATAVPGDPHELDIHRAANHHIAFGYGIHQCLGQPLARAELQLAYPALLRRMPGLALAVPLEEVPFKHDMNIYGLHAMPVTW